MGNINGDGTADLLLSDIKDAVFGEWPASRTFALYGSPTLHGRSTSLTAPEGNVHLVSASTGSDDFGVSLATVGDFNGDGFTDCAVAAPDGVTDSTMGGGYAVQIYGAGDTAPATVTLTRNVDHISNFNEPEMLADVAWELTTPRTGWTSAQVTFRYLDSEIDGLVEPVLTLYHAPGPNGPWMEVELQSLDTRRNEITATVEGFSHFVIAQKGTGMPAAQWAGLLALLALICGLGVWSTYRRHSHPLK